MMCIHGVLLTIQTWAQVLMTTTNAEWRKLITRLPWQRCFVSTTRLYGRLSWLKRSLRECDWGSVSIIPTSRNTLFEGELVHPTDHSLKWPITSTESVTGCSGMHTSVWEFESRSGQCQLDEGDRTQKFLQWPLESWKPSVGSRGWDKTALSR